MKKLTALIGTGALILAAVVFFRLSGSGTAALWEISREGTWLLPLVAVSALIDSVNPCAFSILLITIAFLMSLGKTRRSILATGSSYIGGVFVVYVLIGLGIVGTLHLFNTPHFMAKVGAAILFFVGSLSLINELSPSFPVKLRIPQVAHRKIAELMERSSLPAAFALGVLVGLCEFPCTGGPYLMVLGLLHDAASYWTGLGYLLLYNLIFISPLVLILAIAGDSVVLSKVQSWKRDNTRAMRIWGGVTMIALGIFIFFI